MAFSARRLAGPVGMVLLALAWCVFCLLGRFDSPALAEDHDRIVLGMSAAFSGPSSDLGIELYRGSTAYFRQVNREGGVGGRRIVINAYDDGYNPTPAIANTMRLIQDDHALCLFDYVGTPTVTRVLPLIKSYADRHIYLFFPFTGAQPQREDPYEAYVYNLRASYRQELAELVVRLNMIGRERIAVFYQADAYGRSGWDGVHRALHCMDREIVAEATYSRGATFAESMAEQVAIIQAGRPDAVICVGSYAACAAFIRDARDAGLAVPIANVSFVGSESMLTLLAGLERQTGSAYTRDLINTQVVPSYDDTSLPAVVEYRRLMDELGPLGAGEQIAQPTDYPYSFVSFEGFLNAKVMVEILRRMDGDFRPDRLPAAVESIRDLDIGIDVPVSFGPDRHQGLDTVYFTTVRDGRFVSLTAGDWERWRQ